MKIIFYARIVLIIALIGMSISCSGSSTIKASDYDALCKIYGKIVPEKLDLVIKISKITKEVQKELPAFFEQDFVNIQNADANKRYALIKQLAEEAKGKKWDCMVMKKFYETEFH